MEVAKGVLKANSRTDRILDILVGIVLVVVIILAFTKGGTDQVTTVFLIIFLAFLLFLRQGRLAKLKFNREGFEATMAEVREATQEAEKATKEINEFMKITAAAVLGLVKRTGRAGGYSYDDKEQIRQEYLTNLREMGVSHKEIEEIEKKSKWHEYVAVDYVYHILRGRFFSPGREPSPEQARVEAKEMLNRPISNLATPDELEELMRKHSILTEEARELIEDYRSYREHHEQRRRDVWAKQSEWFKGGERGRAPN